MKTAEMGRGPPYQKEDKVVSMSDLYYKGKRVELLSVSDKNAQIGTSERMRIALGVMSIEEDMETLHLDE